MDFLSLTYPKNGYLCLVVLEPRIARNLAVSASVNSATVTWDVPASGIVNIYEITLNRGTAVVTKTKQSQRILTFGSLDAGTLYTVLVVAVSGDQRSEALEKTFYTRESLFFAYIGSLSNYDHLEYKSHRTSKTQLAV